MFRQYHGGSAGFAQPDPYDGSYSLSDPQSFNRYAYVGNDPVNFTDPSGLRSSPKPGSPCRTKPGGVVDGIVGEDGKCYGGPAETVEVSGSGDSRFLDSFFRGGGGRVGWSFSPIPMIGAPKGIQQPCPPTGKELANDPVVIGAMQDAWRDSKPGMREGVRREQGGWIYARNGQTIVRCARTGTSDEIPLNNPPRIPGALLVGNFHTHPGFQSQGFALTPSDKDVALELARGVPGLVMVEGMKIIPYGPDRRGSNPEFAYAPGNSVVNINGYPGNTANTSNCP